MGPFARGVQDIFVTDEQLLRLMESDRFALCPYAVGDDERLVGVVRGGPAPRVTALVFQDNWGPAPIADADLEALLT